MLKKKLLLRKGMALLLTTVLSAGACIHTPLVVDSAAVNADSSVAEAEPDLHSVRFFPCIITMWHIGNRLLQCLELKIKFYIPSQTIPRLQNFYFICPLQIF